MKKYIRDLYDRKDEEQEKFWAMSEHNRRKESKLTEVETRLEPLRRDNVPYRSP